VGRWVAPSSTTPRDETKRTGTGVRWHHGVRHHEAVLSRELHVSGAHAMPDLTDGRDLTAAAEHPAVAVLVLRRFEDDDTLFEAMRGLHGSPHRRPRPRTGGNNTSIRAHAISVSSPRATTPQLIEHTSDLQDTS
jgi:hypothetical protein